MLTEWITFANQHTDTLMFAGIGGFLLWTNKVREHYNRPEESKMGILRYLGVHFIMLLWLPLIGTFVAFLYLKNGDTLGALLSFQVGLSAPAILDVFMARGANLVAQKLPVNTDPEQ